MRIVRHVFWFSGKFAKMNAFQGNVQAIVPSSTELGLRLVAYSLNTHDMNDEPHYSRGVKADDLLGRRVAMFYNLPLGKYRVMPPDVRDFPGGIIVSVIPNDTVQVDFTRA